MRAPRAIVWFLVLNLGLQTALNGASPPSAPVDLQKALETTPSEVPPSVRQFFELQKLAELTQSPDWALVIAGIAIAFWGGRQIVGDIGVVFTTTLPAAVRYRELSKVLKIGEEAESALTRMAEEMKPLGREAQRAAFSLQTHINGFPDKLSHRRNIQNKRPVLVAEKLSEPGVREAIAAHPKGKAWLAEYDRLAAFQKEAESRLIERFLTGTGELLKFSDRANEAGRGNFRNANLPHRPIVYGVVPMINGPPGSLSVKMDGGFYMDVPDPSFLHFATHSALTKCGDLLARVRSALDQNLVAIRVGSVFVPASHLATAALGVGMYRWGAEMVRERTKSSVDELLEKAKARARVETTSDPIAH
jgi:hypothetical protein